MKTSVNYLLSGPDHLPYLVVSLNELRKHWQGEVNVYAWPESFDIARHIETDWRLGIKAYLSDPTYRGKNAQFFAKIKLMQTIKSDIAVYLDADTMPVKDISQLFEVPTNGFLATQFCDWTSDVGQPKNRVSRLIGREDIDQEAVMKVITERYPSLNGGVFGCCPDSTILPLWENWTSKVLDIFIADETVLHALLPYSEANNLPFKVELGGRFNCSPKYIPSTFHDEDVTIWHFHGDSNLRPEKCPKGVYLWWKAYRQCRQQNIGAINGWIHQIGNTYLRQVEATPVDTCRYCFGDADFGHKKNCPLFGA